MGVREHWACRAVRRGATAVQPDQLVSDSPHALLHGCLLQPFVHVCNLRKGVHAYVCAPGLQGDKDKDLVNANTVGLPSVLHGLVTDLHADESALETGHASMHKADS